MHGRIAHCRASCVYQKKLNKDSKTTATHLVYSLEWWDGLALVYIEGGIDDAAVLDVNLWRIGVAQPGEGMLHPVLVVTLGKKLGKANMKKLVKLQQSVCPSSCDYAFSQVHSGWHSHQVHR